MKCLCCCLDCGEEICETNGTDVKLGKVVVGRIHWECAPNYFQWWMPEHTEKLRAAGLIQ